MCTSSDDLLDDSEFAKYMLKPEKVSMLEFQCNKCKEEKPCVLLRGKDKYCKRCFLSGAVHKFKATLGKLRLIRPNDRVLIYHKLGHSSAALLHFLRTGLDLETPKKLKFHPIFVFIEDEYCLSVDERRSLLAKVENQIKSNNFNCYFVSLVELLNNENFQETIIKSESDLIELGNLDKEKVELFLNKLENATSKQEYFNIIIHKYLIKIAILLNCKFIFTPEISVSIASQLLTNISLGRGAHVSLDTGLCDFRHPTIKIIRPLSNFNIKEIVFYNIYNNIELVIGKYKRNEQSIQDLMQKFVNNLQINYPATVNTILNTGNKLTFNEDITEETKCKLCQAPITNLLDLNSAEATDFSHFLSTHLTSFNELTQLGHSFKNDYCFACKKLIN